MVKILMFGFPCTKFSISQHNNRETTPYSGIGWELFTNGMYARDKFQPDVILAENNFSMAQPIKEEINKVMGFEFIPIDSALLSAQKRRRIYWIGRRNEDGTYSRAEVTQPEDRGLLLKDILEFSESVVEKEKAYCLCTDHMGTTRDYFKKSESQVVFEPVRVGDIGSNSQAHRVYSCYGKSVNLVANGGGQGAKTGLYFTPLPDELVGLVCDKGKIYEIKDGWIEINVGKFKCNMPDGHYIIRKLTVKEAERLQTLPDGYTENVPGISNSKRYCGIGNGWTAEVIIHLLEVGLKDVPRDEEIQVLSLYDGIGTGMYCLKKMGFTNITYKAYEIEESAIKIAKWNHPEIIECGDAFQLREDGWVY